jgi:hypothetical protein
MSDREIIIESLAKAESRIRTNRLIGRIASALSIFIAIAVFVSLVNVFVSLGRTVLGSFWVLWFAALAAYVVRSLGARAGLIATAADVDRQASLQDEVVSAYWFLNQNVDNPWIDLQIRRAAATVGKLDIRGLYPRIFPSTSYAAAGGLVLLVALHFAPIEPGASYLFTRAQPEIDEPLETEALFDEIEELLERAEALRPSQGIREFQQLLESLENSKIQVDEAQQQMENVESLIDEGNLTVAGILEGLEEVGEDLQQSEDSEAAGLELVEGNPGDAASELERLAEEISTGREPASDLGAALEEAAENRRPGLEELANQMEAGAAGLENDSLEALEQSLIGSAESLNQLADIIESQRLQNEAAARMDALEDALREAQAETEASEIDLQNDMITPNDEVETPFSAGGGAPQPGEGESAGNQDMTGQDMSGLESETESGGEGGDQAGEAPGENGDSLNADANGLIPMGYGYSPAIKEGTATSLDVLLQEELVEVEMNEIASDTPEEIPELSSRREASALDYRNVPSDLTPAQQDLLNPDRIPREYQTLIKQYFEAIRTEQ